MSANLFDAGDFQRLDREATLTEQAPRMLPEDDRSPNEEPIRDEPSDDLDNVLLEGLMLVLKKRLEGD